MRRPPAPHPRRASQVYGFGAGIFFWTYTLLEVPSNMLMPRFGAIRWLSRIMVSWGIVASCGVFLQNQYGFYALRLALGVAEAGFYPGMAFYLAGWFEGDEFGEAYAWVTLGSCSSGILGGPLAIAILSMDGLAGLQGWRWLFLLEGVPAVVLGFTYQYVLPNKPQNAAWLSPRQAAWVNERNRKKREAAERAQAAKEAKAGRHALLEGGETVQLTALQRTLLSAKLAASCWRIWYLAVVHFFGLMAYYGILFWLPQLVKSIIHPPTPPPTAHPPPFFPPPFATSTELEPAGGSPVTVAHRLPDSSVIGLSMVPYCFASLALVLNAAHSRKSKEQRWHAVLPMAFGAIGLAITFPLKEAGHPGWALVAITVGVVGSWAEHGPMAALWEEAGAELGHDAQAVAFAIINSVANFGGFVGPYLLGKASDKGGQATGTLILAFALGMAVLMVTFYPIPERKEEEEGAGEGEAE